jgi:Tol biopolymer transport system component
VRDSLLGTTTRLDSGLSRNQTPVISDNGVYVVFAGQEPGTAPDAFSYNLRMGFAELVSGGDDGFNLGETAINRIFVLTVTLSSSGRMVDLK